MPCHAASTISNVCNILDDDNVTESNVVLVLTCNDVTYIRYYEICSIIAVRTGMFAEGCQGCEGCCQKCRCPEADASSQHSSQEAADAATSHVEDAAACN
jgi:hypothetical protein